ncbi:MAG: hypothetical protein GC159_00895 [Phycisphaera sp.]|nr:hypothetical protein [Phycisphaera sp.]
MPAVPARRLNPIHRATRLTTIIALLAVAMLTLGGCSAFGGGGSLDIRTDSDNAPAVFTGSFSTAVYSAMDENDVDIILIEGSEDAPKQAMHIRMHWMPRAGRTPVDDRATNATVRLVVFQENGAAVYSGAGFLFPHSTPGASNFTANLRSTALRLIDSTPGFSDALGAANATGAVSAVRDDDATLRIHRAIETALAAKLGYPRFVLNDKP